MRDPHPPDDETTVNRVWNTVVAGLPDEPGSTDPSVDETLRHLHALGAAPPPASSRERVRQRLRTADRSRYRDGGSIMPGDASPWRPSPNGSVIDPALARPLDRSGPTRMPWRRLSALPAAALLLAIVGAVIVGAIVASRDPDQWVDQPPIVAPSTLSPVATPEDATLLDIDIPAEAIPDSDGYVAGITYDTVPAGAVTEVVWSNSCCHGPLVQHVLGGALTFTVGAPTSVVRADGSTETVPADSAVELVPGDTLLSRNEHTVTITNAGAEPADIVGWHLLDDPNEMFAGRREEGWIYRDFEATTDVPPITGSVALTLRREVLVPGDVVLVFAGNLSLAVTADPEVDVFKRYGDGGIYPIDSRGDATVVYVITMIPLRT